MPKEEREKEVQISLSQSFKLNSPESEGMGKTGVVASTYFIDDLLPGRKY